MSLSRKARGGIVLAVLFAGAALALQRSRTSTGECDPRLAVVKQRAFTQTIRSQGSLQPVNRHPIVPKVEGTVLRLAADGSTVEQGVCILEIDATPYKEKLDGHQRRVRQLKAEWDRDEKKALKDIRSAEDVVESQKLRLELERVRLRELEQGPTQADEVNKRVTLENARSLFAAKQEELEILQELKAGGFVAEAEARQKQLEVEEQKIQANKADVDYRKLHRPDPVKLSEQRLKVNESEKALASSQEKVRMLQGDLERARSRLKDDLKEEEAEIKEHTAEIESTRHTAPSPGIVLHGRGRWGQGLAPGREVHSGTEAMTVSDMRKMKAVVTIDEGRIGRVVAGLGARVRLMGHSQEVYAATVTKTAEKGRDEFEEFNTATRDLTGKANRQVFDVEMELADAGRNLRPAQRVEVEVEVRSLPDALVVPRSAVYRDGTDSAWVFVAGDGAPERRAIEVLAEDQQACAVKGLRVGEKVWRVRP